MAERELDQNDALIFDILDLRAAASAWRAYQSADRLDAKAKRALLAEPLVGEVMAVEFGDVEAERER